jgi:DNA polymerase-3 subunit delta'
MSAKTAAADKAPEPDLEPGCAHPRDTFQFFGHEHGEHALAEGLRGARMHHAWLITGPKGVGKATLAYRFARVALGAKNIGPRPFDVDADDPIARKISAQAHPDLKVVRRGLNDKGKLRTEITVDEARKLGGFLALRPAEDGWRVVIIDALEEMNRNAANAILKLLEEPPPRTVMLLLCNAPGAILATIRSRCRRLDLRALSDEHVGAAVSAAGLPAPDGAIMRFAAGRPGRAIALAQTDIGAIDGALREAMRQTRQQPLHHLMPLVFEKSGAQQSARLALFFDVARAMAAQGGLSDSARAPVWADIFSDLMSLEREADGLNMDVTHTFARACAILNRARAP